MPSEQPAAPGWRSGARAYARGALRDDALAAGIVTVLMIPQSLAYALLAGLPPQVGVYASLLPLLAYAALGSSPVLGIGPAAVLALMISQAIASVAHEFAALPGALVLAAEVGIILALAAALRLDALASLLSVPVLHGFETGATVSIALSQLPVLLGSSARGSNLPDLLFAWSNAGVPWQPVAALFGVAAAVVLWLGRRHAVGLLGRWLPPARAALMARLLPLAVLGAAVAVAGATDAGAHGVALVGPLPALTPQFTLPLPDAALWWRLLPSALLIAGVAFVSSLAVAESLANRSGQRIDARRELAGLAAANLAAAASGGMPVSGSFSRSIVVFDAGGRTRMAGAFTAVFMLLAMLLLARPLAALPTAVLAATIIVAVLSVITLAPFREAWRYARVEWWLMAGVAVLTVGAGVAWALGLGVAASIALLLQRSAQPHLARIGRVPGTEHYRNVDRHEVLRTPGVLALRIDESLLFTNARRLLDAVMQQVEAVPGTQRVVLLMSPVNAIDLSGLAALHGLHDALAARRIRLDLSEVKGPVLDRLQGGQWNTWFKGRVFLSHHQGMVDEAP